MSKAARIVKEPWDAALRRDGFQFVPAATMRAALGELDDWATFVASWNDLPWDEYLAQHGRYRRRRHAVFHAAGEGDIERVPHEPHYQSVAYNPLQGGIERWFEGIS